MAGYRKLGRTSSQRKALLRNQVTALRYAGKMITTEAKAQEIRKIAEGIIALGIKECNNFDTVTVTAKVARKDKDGKRVKEVVDGKKVTVYDNIEKELNAAAKAAKAEPEKLEKKIQSMQEEIRALQSENEKLKTKLANEAAGDVDSQIQEIAGVKVLAMSVPEVDMNGLRTLGDQMKEKIGEGVVVLASAVGGKVSLLAMATDDAMKHGAHAGNLIKAIASEVGGGGGGRPNMAQAGGKNPAGIDNAIAKVKEVLEGQLK